MEIIGSKIDNVINHCNKFVSEHRDILAILLVGSYARNAQKSSSDIDLVILTESWKQYVDSKEWLSGFGKPLSHETEYYGLITSLRVQYEEYEIEFGFGSSKWISEPVDPGTRRVLTDGYRILFERDAVLRTIKESIKPF